MGARAAIVVIGTARALVIVELMSAARARRR
jgi:hypothetical protein